MKVWIALTITLLCTHCAATQLQGRHYRDGENSFYIGVLPEAWRALDLGDNNDLAWQDSRSGAVLQLNASCDPALDIPLRALRNHLLMGFTDREFHDEKKIMIAAREALRSELTAKLDGQPRSLLLVVLKKDGCVYDFALMGRQTSKFGNSKADFQTFLSGFRT